MARFWLVAAVAAAGLDFGAGAASSGRGGPLRPLRRWRRGWAVVWVTEDVAMVR